MKPDVFQVRTRCRHFEHNELWEIRGPQTDPFVTVRSAIG